MSRPNRPSIFFAFSTIFIVLAVPTHASDKSASGGNVTVNHDAKQVCTNGSHCTITVAPPRPPKCERSLKYLSGADLRNCIEVFDKQLRFFDASFRAEQEKAAFKTQDKITAAKSDAQKKDEIRNQDRTAQDNALVDHGRIFITTYRPEALRYISELDRRLALEPPSSKADAWDETYAARTLYEDGWDYSRLADYLDRIAQDVPE